MSRLSLALFAGALVFIAASLMVLGVGRWITERGQRQRLQGLTGARDLPEAEREKIALPPGAQRNIHALMSSLSRLAMPQEGWQSNAVRLRFIQAGLRGEEVARQYYTIKSGLTVILPLLLGLVLYLFYDLHNLLYLSAVIFTASAAGFYLPDLLLRMRTQMRVSEMRDNLPDLIDLLVICTESGLALDQAVNRVSHEIARSSRMVAEEFHLVTLEIRAGADRPAALRNLALRVKLDDLSNFASMLIQADKFGTSIAEALRIQSEVMRVRRMQRAEELAAKIPTKMLLPLVLCIFPVLMIVMLGPAVIQLLGAFSQFE